MVLLPLAVSGDAARALRPLVARTDPDAGPAAKKSAGPARTPAAASESEVAALTVTVAYHGY